MGSAEIPVDASIEVRVMSTLPILYSFRRCPYAMRARLALLVSNIHCELREVKLSNKPVEMLAAPTSGTVPLLVLSNEQVIDESLDIAIWALQQNDPHGWLEDIQLSLALIQENDTSFKHWLDRYKYHVGYPEQTQEWYREKASEYLLALENRLTSHAYLMGDTPRLADAMIFPFIRQFSSVDADWWASSPYNDLRDWLAKWCGCSEFALLMKKLTPWVSGTAGVIYPFRDPAIDKDHAGD